MVALNYGNFLQTGGSSGSGSVAVGNGLYVDGTNGKDTNNGNFGTPYQSVTAALAVATSGQTVFIIAPGTYSQANNEISLASGVSIVATNPLSTTLAFSGSFSANQVCFNPAGSNYIYGLSITYPTTANSTVIGVGFNSALGDTIGTNIEFDNCQIQGWGPAVAFKFSSTAASGPLNWLFNDCNLTSNSNCVATTISGSHAWAGTFTFRNTGVAAVADGATNNTLRGLLIGANALGTNIYQFLGGQISATGGGGALNIGAVISANDKLTLNGTSLIANGATVNTPYVGAVLFQPSGYVWVDPNYGDDTLGNGSPNQPFKSLAVAAAVAVAGQTVKIAPAIFTIPNPVTFAAGVSVNGSGRGTGGTIMSCTGTGSAFSILTISGQCELSDFRLIGAIAQNSNAVQVPISSSGGTSGPFVFRNIEVNGCADVLALIGGNGFSAGSTVLSTYGCRFTSQWDINHNNFASGTVAQYHDTEFITTWDGSTGNPLPAFQAISSGVTFKGYNCRMIVNNTTSAATAVAVSCTGGAIVELYSCELSTSGTNQNVINCIGAGSSVLIGNGCKISPISTMNTDGTGTIVGMNTAIIGAPGTTVAAGPAAGGSPTVTLQAGSDDVSGVINVLTGTLPSATGGLLATLTWGSPKAYTLAPVVSAAENVLSVTPYAKALGSTAAQIGINVGVLAGATMYSFAYFSGK